MVGAVRVVWWVRVFILYCVYFVVLVFWGFVVGEVEGSFGKCFVRIFIVCVRYLILVVVFFNLKRC